MGFNVTDSETTSAGYKSIDGTNLEVSLTVRKAQSKKCLHIPRNTRRRLSTKQRPAPTVRPTTTQRKAKICTKQRLAAVSKTLTKRLAKRGVVPQVSQQKLVCYKESTTPKKRGSAKVMLD